MVIDRVFARGDVERRPTPLVRGGVSNHGSLTQNVVISHN